MKYIEWKNIFDFKKVIKVSANAITKLKRKKAGMDVMSRITSIFFEFKVKIK